MYIMYIVSYVIDMWNGPSRIFVISPYGPAKEKSW